MQYECFPDEVLEQYEKIFDGDNNKARKAVEKLPSFKSEYQVWFSEAQNVVKQVLPDRFADFNSHYEYPRVRKSISYGNYMVRDYLQGLQVTRSYEVVVDSTAAINEFRQQLNIIKAARSTLDSVLMDLRGMLQADLFDSEVEAAEALMKAGYMRASGAMCGVVIERHLQSTCAAHNITVRKKHPNISDLNQLLKDSGIIEVPQWRFVQHLADIRNLCDHAKKKEPSGEEISDLVLGTKKILKTIF